MSFVTQGKQLIGRAGLALVFALASTVVMADYNVTIGSGASSNGSWSGVNPDVWTPSASGAVVSASEIQTRLSGGASVTIVTSGGGSESGDITLGATIGWTANTLTLTAARDININAVMTASGTAALTMTTTSGTVRTGFLPGLSNGFAGRVDFPGRAGIGFLSINGQNYHVINTLGTQGSASGLDLQGIEGNPTGNYALGSDIDASSTIGWDGGNGFGPIANFFGSFDGLGHTISRLSINRTASNYVGLFGRISSNSVVRNFVLTDSSIVGSVFTGGIGGLSFGWVMNVSVDGVVTGDKYVGGIIGYQNGNGISTSRFDGNVNGVAGVGGIVGVDWYESRLLDSHYDVDSVLINGEHHLTSGGVYHSQYLDWVQDGKLIIGDYFDSQGQYFTVNNVGGSRNSVKSMLGFLDTGSKFVLDADLDFSGSPGLFLPDFYGEIDGAGHTISGLLINQPSIVFAGFVGRLKDGVIKNLNISNLDITGFSHLGGLVGYVNGGEISNCQVSGVIHGQSFIGGLIGDSELGLVSNGIPVNNIVNDCSSDVDVYATGVAAGGFIGHSYWTNIHSGHSMGEVNGNNEVGGFVGRYNSSGAITDSYSSGNVNGNNGAGGFLGWLESGGGIKIFNSFYNIDSVLINGEHMVTQNGIYNNQYSDWIVDKAILIDDYFTSLSGSYVIDSIDGNVGGLKNVLGFTWTNASFKLMNDLDLSSAPGLYLPNLRGHLDGNGHILSGVYIHQPATSMLGFVAALQGGASISNLGLVNVDILGNRYVGGLAGIGLVSTDQDVYTDASISNSFVTGSVTGEAYVGGFVATGTVIDSSHSSVFVNGSSHLGGMISDGFVGGTVRSSYFSGEIANAITLQAWDSSGYPLYDAYGDPITLTAALMQQQTTFVGWDFDNVWRIYDGQTYPLLRAFLTPATVTANNDSRAYSGVPYSGGNDVTCSPGPCTNASYLGTVSYGGTSQGATAIGSYSIVPTGLYSNQTGYDITYANGTLTIGAATSYTGPSPTQPDHNLTAGFTGGGAGCTLTQSSFTAPPAAPPEGVTFPHGVFNFTASGCQASSTLAVTVTYPQTLPSGAQYWKYINGAWQVIPATINGASVTFNITDNGPLDADGAVGVIRDPGGVGIRAADPSTAQAIPTLSKWGLLLLTGLLGFVAYIRVARQGQMA